MSVADAFHIYGGAPCRNPSDHSPMAATLRWGSSWKYFLNTSSCRIFASRRVRESRWNGKPGVAVPLPRSSSTFPTGPDLWGSAKLVLQAPAILTSLIWTVIEPQTQGSQPPSPPPPDSVCYQLYLAETANCGSGYTDDLEYERCMGVAWLNYKRCLQDQAPI
jgi:hypothetical protein